MAERPEVWFYSHPRDWWMDRYRPCHWKGWAISLMLLFGPFGLLALANWSLDYFHRIDGVEFDTNRHVRLRL